MIMARGYYMNTVTLSNEYQLSIPEGICDAVGLRAGASLEIFSYNNRIELIPIRPIKELKGMFKGIDTNIVRDDDRI
jgi:bifunctional DNA-binding transcriptional regulator/antitoxin component of YhaV-PrlF toxin-antitoxin module